MSQPGEMVYAGHLGGYVHGGDEATQFPDLWRWLVVYRSIASVLDVGCGDGQAVDFFAGLGVDCIGIDGVEQDNPKIATHDFTTGPYNGDIAGFDMVWSCEFVEHVEERYMPNFIEAFKVAPLVLMTHADPGQPGYHHVNCRTADYWIGAMAAHGYRYDDALTAKTREKAAMNPSPWNHYVRSGLAFVRA